MTTPDTAANERTDQYITPGHLACPGCGATLAMQWVLSVLGKDTVLGLPACCFSIISGAFPHTPMNVNLVHTAFETGAAIASGLKAGLEATGRGHAHVVSWAGDGGTFDIGLQALSGAAERNEDIIYVCYDNEAYMNTGNQRSSATPRFARTTTSPAGESMHKKDILAIMAAHGIPYAASASIAFPDDLTAKVEKAKHITGTRFLHILVACPTGWRMPSDMTITAARLAVETGVFPLIEIENGERTTITYLPEPRIPLAEYLSIQGRFSGMSKDEIAEIQRWVNERWERLMKTADVSVP
ncbi:MAG: pyruvate synthase subunit beta [Deltaproteobacteria bacterium]|nr:pyruvate synthase subunit beta [Candidatus Zymogenaceae bacterium]